MAAAAVPAHCPATAPPMPAMFANYYNSLKAGWGTSNDGKFIAVWLVPSSSASGATAGPLGNHLLFDDEQHAMKYVVKNILPRGYEAETFEVGKEDQSFIHKRKKKTGYIHDHNNCHVKFTGQYPNAYRITTTVKNDVTNVQTKTDFFIDTLSDMTSISQAIHDKLLPQKSPRQHTINGVPTNVYWMSITLDRHTTVVKADIDVDDTPLLGRDILNCYRQVYDPPKGIVELTFSA